MDIVWSVFKRNRPNISEYTKYIEVILKPDSEIEEKRKEEEEEEEEVANRRERLFLINDS